MTKSKPHTTSNYCSEHGKSSILFVGQKLGRLYGPYQGQESDAKTLSVKRYILPGELFPQLKEPKMARPKNPSGIEKLRELILAIRNGELILSTLTPKSQDIIRDRLDAYSKFGEKVNITEAQENFFLEILYRNRAAKIVKSMDKLLENPKNKEQQGLIQ